MLRWYRIALMLCPPAFRRDYAADMLLDAADARAEAAAAGHPNRLWRWRIQIALDFVRTLGVQWLRTGLPVIAIVAAAIPLAIVAGLASVARRVRVEIPADLADADMIGVVLLATLVLCFIAMTIVLTIWTSRQLRRGRR